MMYNYLYSIGIKKQQCAKGISIQEGTKDICMCFRSDKKQHHESNVKGKMLEFHTTRCNVLIPIFVSTLVFITEIYSVYYVAGESVNCLNICRLFNTTFIPTHIATTTVFLYQHFSLGNNFNNGEKMRSINDMEVKPEYAGLTVVSTVLLSLFYVLCSFKVGLGNQFFLIALQCVYIWLLWKYGIRDTIVIYEKPIKNVVSY